MKPYYETKLGRLYCGDCLEIIRQLPNKSVDFAFADPPYGIKKAKWDIVYPIGFEKELLRISRKGIAITPGQENLAVCIMQLGKEYKGILCARSLNGMTFNKIGFENWIPVVLGGQIKRGQSYFDFVVKGSKPSHPSPKPIEFMIKLLNRFTEINNLILDPFLGSGTTAVACEQLGRRWIGIEIEEKYCEIAAKRIEAERQQLKLF